MPPTAPDRYEQIRRTYVDCFEARSSYMPLIVSCRCPGGPRIEQLWKDTGPAVRQAAEAMAPRVEIDSDWVPSINIGAFQSIVIPQLYGAEMAETAGGEPICHACFNSVATAAAAPVPALQGAPVDDLLRAARQAREALPEGFHLSLPASGSPWDIAQLMIGAEFLVGLLLDPDAAHAFLATLTDQYIALNRMVQAEIGQGDRECITNRGMYFPGFRVPADSIVNLSPDLLRQFVVPYLERIRDGLGPICLHFCTSPAPSGHVLPVLLETDAVIAVDNWQRSEVFWGPEAPAPRQDRIAIVGDERLENEQQIDAFLASEPVTAVPREGGRGIVRQTWAPDVETGRAVYRMWREKQGV